MYTGYSAVRSYAFAYLRLSVEEAQSEVSSSIKNQKSIIEKYCEDNGIILLQIFSDDGWSGGNFDRPGFKAMISSLPQSKANMVITKDLSRLGRDMRESSYYAEEYFPDHGIRYIAIADHFDNEVENIMAPFQFAMNEVYLRDGSRKIRDVLKNKRETGQYCACPPYGYRKDENDRSRLVPDEMTAPIVQRIFRQAADGDSSRTISMALNEDGIIPPLKYRVLYRDNFGEKGASRASDVWNGTTVKRILKNQVYLGYTILGKTKKPSIKSKKKINLPKDSWVITPSTHEPLVTEAIFEKAKVNMGRATTNYQAYSHVRKSIFGGIAFCSLCGHALCSAGTVYKGEREKYWYLSCTHQRQDIIDPCSGVRIRYADLLEVVRQDLNQLISMEDQEISRLVQSIVHEKFSEENKQQKKIRIEKTSVRLKTIDKIITKLYTDNAEGKIENARMESMVSELEKEAIGLRSLLEELTQDTPADVLRQNYAQFFQLAKQYTHIDELDRDILTTFIDRIEVGPKILPPGLSTSRTTPYKQCIRIFYKFIGELNTTSTRDLPPLLQPKKEAPDRGMLVSHSKMA